MSQDVQILRDTDPHCDELETAGYTLVGESWGARLLLEGDNDLSIYSEAIRRVLENGIHIQELGVGFAEALLELELINNPDYPSTPATFHAVPTTESTRALWCPDNRIFGAINDGVLIGAVATSRKDKIIELDFGSLSYLLHDPCITTSKKRGEISSSLGGDNFGNLIVDE